MPVVEIRQVDTVLWAEGLGGRRGTPRQPGYAWRLSLGRGGQRRGQQLGEEEGSEVVGPELQLVSLLRLGTPAATS